jgi:hypothetical protein
MTWLPAHADAGQRARRRVGNQEKRPTRRQMGGGAGRQRDLPFPASERVDATTRKSRTIDAGQDLEVAATGLMLRRDGGHASGLIVRQR